MSIYVVGKLCDIGECWNCHDDPISLDRRDKSLKEGGNGSETLLTCDVVGN